MLPTTIRFPPSVADYTPIEEHQSQTPETFFGGKPVLHYHLDGAKAWMPASERGLLAAAPFDAITSASPPEGADPGEALAEREVSVFVNSENLTIFCAAAEVGVAIPYPSISIHAVKEVGRISETTPLRAIWLQVQLAEGGAGDDVDYETAVLTIVPAVADGAQPDVQKFYDAISACSDLHPDPEEEEDDDDADDRIVFEGDHEPVEGYSGVLHGAADGGLPPAFPGSGGWITAENVHLHFDADGNWIDGRGGEGENGEEGGGLGEGAGRVRDREEEVNGGGVNGHDDPENKRRRVDEQ